MTTWQGYGSHFLVSVPGTGYTRRRSNPWNLPKSETGDRKHILHSHPGMGRRRFRILTLRRSLKLLCCLFLVIFLLLFVVILLSGHRRQNLNDKIHFIELTNFDYDEKEIWNLDTAKKLYFLNPDPNEAQRSYKIPKIYPFKEVALSLIARSADKQQLDPPACLQSLPWFKTNLNSRLVRLEETSNHWFKVDCFYFPFQLNDMNKIIIPPEIEEPISMKDHAAQFPIPDKYENIIVQCIHKDGGKLAYNACFNFFRQNETLMEEKTETLDALSVIYLGVSSVSLTNFQRFLPKTRSFLMRNLSAIEFTGLNSVDEKRDKFAILETYAKLGYLTIRSEDRLYGNQTLKTDYNNLAYLQGIYSISPQHHRSSGCFKDQFMPNHIRDRIVEVASKLSGKPYFHYAWTSETSRLNAGHAKYLDSPFVEMLKSLKENGLLNNTVLIMTSDEGIPKSEYSRSADGLLESRNPFLYMVLPEWFKVKYSKAMSNLVQNSNELITSKDLDKTLEHLQNLELIENEGLNAHKPGASLFLPIPSDRNCNSAQIPEDACICRNSTQMNETEDINIIAALSFTLDYINKELEGYSECHQLDLAKLIHGDIIKNEYEEILYEITFEVLPSHDIFSTVLKHEFSDEDPEFSFIDNIKRLGLGDHRNQNECLGYFKRHFSWIRNFCYCKENAYA